MKTHPGFIAALDQSGGSTPKALQSYGIKEDAWSNEAEMFCYRASDAPRALLPALASPASGFLSAILFENTMDREIEGTA